jgi:hypothetical protein
MNVCMCEVMVNCLSMFGFLKKVTNVCDIYHSNILDINQRLP